VAEDFEESLDYGDIYGRLDSILGLTRSGGYHVKLTSEEKTEFRVWGLNVDIQNAPFASVDQVSARFVANCTIEMEAPVSFAGRLLPFMRITIKTSAGYTPKF
jgi:hypothetical protein